MGPCFGPWPAVLQRRGLDSGDAIVVDVPSIVALPRTRNPELATTEEAGPTAAPRRWTQNSGNAGTPWV